MGKKPTVLQNNKNIRRVLTIICVDDEFSSFDFTRHIVGYKTLRNMKIRGLIEAISSGVPYYMERYRLTEKGMVWLDYGDR